jgi:hypothetical protein
LFSLNQFVGSSITMALLFDFQLWRITSSFGEKILSQWGKIIIFSRLRWEGRRGRGCCVPGNIHACGPICWGSWTSVVHSAINRKHYKHNLLVLLITQLKVKHPNFLYKYINHSAIDSNYNNPKQSKAGSASYPGVPKLKLPGENSWLLLPTC